MPEEKIDYAGNSNKSKQVQAEGKPEKVVEKVVVGTVIVQKKTLGQKFKDTFLDKEFFLQMFRDTYRNRVIPNARNMLFDAGMEMLKQGVYRNGSATQVFDPKSVISRFTTYGGQVNRPMYPGMPYPNAIPANTVVAQQGRPTGPVPTAPRQPGRPSGENFIIPTRQEAQLTLAKMLDFIEGWDVVTVQDLHELLGVPITDHLANMWGWTSLQGVDILQVPQGWVIDLPPAQPINVR